jgi:outer membrane protein assembly factor BamB
MFKRLLRLTAWTLAVLIAAGAILYAAGLRVVVLGGGSLRFEFLPSDDERAREIEAHRRAQQTATPPPGAAATSAPSSSAGSQGAAVGPAPFSTDTTTYWTDFRGPRRDGVYREMAIRTDWPASGLTPLWKIPVGGGYASMVIARGRLFTIEQRGREEVVAAYDAATGRELWAARWRAEFREAMGGPGPRATPVWSDGRVYALGATGELVCLDETTGATRWRVNILDDNDADNLDWGMAGSPLVHGDTVIVNPGGGRRRSIVAYHRLTGARVWSTLDDQAGYSSPMLATLAGVPQVLVFAGQRLLSVSPDTGALLWSYPWTTQYDVNAAQPIVIGDDRVFISSGYGSGAAVVAITRAGSGFEVREVWRNIRMKNQFTSSVLHDGHLYGLDESILACLDAATGELKWKGGRYGYGQVLLASGHLIVLSESGELALVRATPERHDERVRFPAIEGKTWNHMAMSGGRLFVRNLQQMAAFDVRAK